jgi:hypothetical protein
MIKRFATVTSVLAVFALAGASSVVASKPKPLGYIYGQCTKKTDCNFQGTANPKQSEIAVSETGLCPTGAIALAQAGFAKVKHGGKFALSKTLHVENDYEKFTVQVKLTGTLKVGKKATGDLTVTTTAGDCTTDTGVKKPFSMKYIGPTYGG